jgi:trimethylamine--corrinoid protein Co-methyltransferase
MKFDRSSCRAQPKLSFLDEGGLEAIHLAALEILERTGVWVQHEGVVEMLASAGCKVTGPNRITIPPQLVEESLKKAPSEITIHNRKGEGTRQN